jgi:hypothetical protein
MSSRVPIFAGEEVLMAEVRVWQLAQMDGVVLLCEEVAHSNSLQCKLHPMPALADKAMISRDGEARLVTPEARPETSKAIGETNRPRASHLKINKVKWVISKAQVKTRAVSSLDTAIAVP